MTGMVPVATGIIRQDNKLLLARRPEGKPYSGFWEFPGGKLEPGESSIEALTRELKEELGITVFGPQFLFNHTHAYPDKCVQLSLWLVDDFDGEPQGRENQTLYWATWSEMMTLNLLEGNWPVLERLKFFCMVPPDAMRQTSNIEKNTAPGVICTAPWRLTTVKPLDNYKLEVKFVDGTHGFVEMSQRVKSDKAGVFAALKDVGLFNQVHLEYGVVTWPGEIDLAPDAMHDEIRLHGKWVLI